MPPWVADPEILSAELEEVGSGLYSAAELSLLVSSLRSPLPLQAVWARRDDMDSRAFFHLLHPSLPIASRCSPSSHTGIHPVLPSFFCLHVVLEGPSFLPWPPVPGS